MAAKRISVYSPWVSRVLYSFRTIASADLDWLGGCHDGLASTSVSGLPREWDDLASRVPVQAH
jgi:hypothetical protein